MSIRRLKAIQVLLNGLNNYKKSASNCEILKSCFWDRLNDECLEVVVEILKLPTSQIIEIIDCGRLVSSLMMILYKLQMHQLNNSDVEGKENPVMSLILLIAKHLTNNQVLQNYDNNVILLTLLPLLFPDENEWFSNDVIQTVLDSELSKCFKFLNRWKTTKNSTKLRNCSECKAMFAKVISEENENISATEFLESVMKIHNIEGFKEYKQLHYILILITGFLNKSLSIDDIWQIFKNIQILQQGYNIKNIKPQSWKLSSYENCIPLKLYSDFIIKLVKQTSFQGMVCSYNEWENPANKEFQFFLCLFEVLTSGVFDKDLTNNDQKIWSAFLKEVCDIVFDNNENTKQNFLINFYIYEKSPIAVPNYFELRLKAFNLMKNFIRKLNSSSDCKWTIMHVLQMCTALIDENKIIRQETMKTLENLHQYKFKVNEINTDNYDNDLQNLLGSILSRKEEILMDNEQFALMFYIILKKRKELCINVVSNFTTFIEKHNELTCPLLLLKLSNIFTHFNHVKILYNQVQMAINNLKNWSVVENDMRILRGPYDNLLYVAINCLNSKEFFDEDIFSNFVEEIYKSSKIFVIKDNCVKSVPCVFLEIITEQTFSKLTSYLQNSIILRTIDFLAEVDNNDLYKSIRKLSKSVNIDCTIFVPIIEGMMKSRKEQISGIQKIPVDTMQWRRGNIVMELIEGNEKLLHGDKLLPSLFEVFNLCLFTDDQITVEFSRQLVLSVLLDCCKLAKEDKRCDFDKLSKNVIRIDQIVECLRISVNPQTQQNALLLLTYCANFIPQEVLNNIVNIFTFMGSSVVRVDDAFSFIIIKDIIDTIVPILIKDGTFLIPVLKVFSDIMVDVPEHRRLSLYTCLISALDAKQYFWMFLCVVFEAQIMDEEKRINIIKSDEMIDNENAEITMIEFNTNNIPRRIEILLDLINSFDISVILETGLKLMKYVNDLPITKPTSKLQNKKNIEKFNKKTNLVQGLFDVNIYSNKLLRKYIYIIIKFLAAVTNSNKFLRKVVEYEEICNKLDDLKDIYQQFIVQILSYISSINENSNEGLPEMSISVQNDLSLRRISWNLFILHVYDLLDNVVSLLSSDAYIAVVSDLVHHQLLTVRKRILELFINKLRKDNGCLNSCSEKSIRILIDAMNRIVLDIRMDQVVNAEIIHIQQSALICIKLLSKQLALNYIELFSKTLINLHKIIEETDKLSNKNSLKILYATIHVTNIEIMCNLRAHGLPQLPIIMKQLNVALNDQAKSLGNCKYSEDNSICLTLVIGKFKYKLIFLNTIFYT